MPGVTPDDPQEAIRNRDVPGLTPSMKPGHTRPGPQLDRNRFHGAAARPFRPDRALEECNEPRWQ